jgi:hypothetical protein
VAFRNPVTTLPASGITSGTLNATVDLGPAGVLRAGPAGAGHLDVAGDGAKLYGSDGVTVLVNLDPAGVTVAGSLSANDPTVAGLAFVQDGQIGFTDPRGPVTLPGTRWAPGGSTSTPAGPRLVRNAAGGLVVSGRQPLTLTPNLFQPNGYRDGALLLLDSTDGTATNTTNKGTTTATLTADTFTAPPRVEWTTITDAQLSSGFTWYGAGWAPPAWMQHADGAVELRGLLKVPATAPALDSMILDLAALGIPCVDNGNGREPFIVQSASGGTQVIGRVDLVPSTSRLVWRGGGTSWIGLARVGWRTPA